MDSVLSCACWLRGLLHVVCDAAESFLATPTVRSDDRNHLPDCRLDTGPQPQSGDSISSNICRRYPWRCGGIYCSSMLTSRPPSASTFLAYDIRSNHPSVHIHINPWIIIDIHTNFRDGIWTRLDPAHNGTLQKPRKLQISENM